MLHERKKQHLDIVLAGNGHPGVLGTGFENVRFEHCALPELNIEDIRLDTTFLGRQLKLPFLVSSMTGGPAMAETINSNLAMACEHLGIPLAVGSQRVAIESEINGGLDLRIRRLAPSVPILANLGAAQLVAGYGLQEAQRAIDMIQANGLILHLNPLQEAVQSEGDKSWAGVADAIARLCHALSVPVLVKEVGYGISASVARTLVDAGVQVIDVAGAGGTSWSTVEAGRAGDIRLSNVASAFTDWGQPTVKALVALRKDLPDIPLIASGGIRNGVDAAKAIRLGADLVGQAAAVLKAATESPESVIEHFDVMATQLRIACFCTGSVDLARLRQARLEQDIPIR